MNKEYAVTSLQEQMARSSQRMESNKSRIHSPGGQTAKAVGDVSPRVSGLVKQVEDLKREISILSSPSSKGTAVRSSPLSGGRDSSGEMNRMKALNDELMTWKDRSESLMAELQSTKRKFASMENEMVRTRELLSQVQEGKEKLERQYTSAKEEIAQLRAVAAQNSTDLKTQLKHSQGVAARHASDADTVSSHAETLQRKMSALVVEKESVEKSRDDALSLMTAAKDAARAASAEKESIAKQLDDALLDLASIKAKYASLEASKRASDAQFEALCAKLESAHSAAQLNESNAAAMAGRASDAHENSSLLLKRLQATQERCDAAELSIEAMRAQLGAVQDTLDAKCEEHHAVVAALEEATNALSSMKVDGGDLVSQKNTLLTSRALMEEKVANLAKDVAERDSRICDMEDHMSSLRSSLETALADVKQKDALLQNAEQALARVTSKSIAEGSTFEAHTGELGEELETAMEQADAAERKAKEAQDLYVNAVETTKRLRESLDAVTAELDETKEFLQAESDRADALSGLLENREDDLKTLRQELSEMKSKAYQADDVLEELAESGKKMDAVHQEVTTAQEHIASLQDQLEAKDKEFEKVVAMKKDGELRIESLENALSDKIAQIEDIKQRLEEAEDSLKSFEERALQAEMKASDARSECRDFEVAAEDAQREIERLNAELQAIKQEVEILQNGSHTEGARIDAFPDAPEVDNAEAMYQEQVSKLQTLLENEQALRREMEAELRVEKRRSMSANMKAAGLNMDTSARTADKTPDADASKENISEVPSSRDLDQHGHGDIVNAFGNSDTTVQESISQASSDVVVKNLVNSILDKYN